MTRTTIDELRAAVEAATGDSDRLAALLALGTELLEHGPPEALAVGIESLALAERIGDGHGIADAMHVMGVVNEKLGNYQIALEQLEQARSRYETLGDRFNGAVTSQHIGKAHYYLSDFARAMESDHATLALFEELGDRRNAVRMLNNIAATNFELGQYDSAMEQFQSVLASYEELDDTEGIARAVSNIGRSYRQRGEYGRAIEKYQLAYTLFDQLGQPWSVAQQIHKIGNVYREVGEYAKALEYLQRALSLSEELGDRQSIAFTKSCIAGVYRGLSEPDKALEYYQSAYVLLSELGDRQGISSTLVDLGNIHAELGDGPGSLECYQSALSLAEEIGDRVRMLGPMTNIGLHYQRLGEYDRALSYLQSALALKEESIDPNHTTFTLAGIGLVYAAPGFEGHDPARAEELFLRALELNVESGNKPYQVMLLQQLAELYQQQSNWEQAHQCITHYYALKEEIQSHEAVKKAEQLEHIKQITEMEKQRAIDQAEAGAAKLRAQLLETQLEHKQQQLTSTAMHVARQSELMGRFRSDLRRIMHQSGDVMEVIRQINEKLKELPGESIDWATFEAEFQQTYPEFRTKLMGKYPDLTKTEVRICSLVRLKLISSDIAQLMSVTDRSVEFHRLNIRKKLRLTREQDLAEVLATL
jgi:tetratricopeptide (TPR) repeat protein/DNA-binding CsgD family transcriptional regulator